MHRYRKARPFGLSTRFLLLQASLILACSARAQLGVVPSEGEMFFDDLRGRSQELAAGAVTTGAQPNLKPIYTFDGYGYNLDEDHHYPAYGDDEKLFGYPLRSGTDTVYSTRYGRQPSNYVDPLIYRNGYFAPTYVTDPFAQSGNIRVGGLTAGIGVGIYGEYTDNWHRNDRNKQDQFTIGTNVVVNLNYQISRYNNLSLNFGMGYDAYLCDSGGSGRNGNQFTFYAAPGSSLAYDFRIGSSNLYATIYDRWSVTQTKQDEFALDDYDIFSRFENDLGVGVNWLINSSLSLGLNFDWEHTMSLDDNFNFADRDVYSVSANLAWSPYETWTTGLTASTSWSSYDKNFNNDGFQYSVGAYLNFPVTRYIDVRLNAGFQDMAFDSGGSSDDNHGLNDWYGNATVRHQINSRLSHMVSAGHETSLNYTSNYTTTDYVNYGISAVIFNGSRLNLSVFYEQENESGGVLEEDRDRFGASVNWSYYLRRDLLLSLGYRIGNVSSDLRERDYLDQTISVDLDYVLTKRTRIHGGYMWNTANADDHLSDYTQNRVYFSVNYNF